MSIVNDTPQLKLRARRGRVLLNGKRVKLGDPIPVGANDLIELASGACYDLFVDTGKGTGPTAASVSTESPVQVVTYTPPTYCYIPYYYQGSSAQANVCTEYGSPAIRL